MFQVDETIGSDLKQTTLRSNFYRFLFETPIISDKSEIDQMIIQVIITPFSRQNALFEGIPTSILETQHFLKKRFFDRWH